MLSEQIARINALARKAKTEGLTEAEREEQARLRDAYRAAFRRSLTGQLDNLYILDENGNEQKWNAAPQSADPTPEDE